MRDIALDRVVLTPAARVLINEGDLQLAGDVPVVTVDVDGNNASACVADETVFVVGATRDDARAWRARASVYVHVGAPEDLPSQIGVTVPLTGQGAAGVRNILRWAGEHRAQTQPWTQHVDVAAHARHCVTQYQDAAHVRRTEGYCTRAAADIIDAFPEIAAVLGTGFPFYCMVDIEDDERMPVPPSIQRYTAVQEELFARKLLRPAGLSRADGTWTASELAAEGVDVLQTTFNAYEYTRHGAIPPSAPDSGSVEDFITANTCSLPDRLWPCHLCTLLHNPARYPEQAWVRDFMSSCLQCGQTPYLPRAVGVLGSDIDLVAVVPDGEPRKNLAGRLAAWIDRHPIYFRHDTDWNRQLGAEHGPLDIFVISATDFLDAVAAMSNGPDWMRVTVPATVTWLPVTDIDYELGKYLALCMEVLRDRSTDGQFGRDLARRRQAFAEHVSAETLIAAFQSDSPYLQQLVSNEGVRDLLCRRLGRWQSGGQAGRSAS